MRGGEWWWQLPPEPLGAPSGAHLFVCQHGLWGSPEDVAFLEQYLQHNGWLTLNARSNSARCTFDGADVCGDRLAAEVVNHIQRLAEAGVRVTHISFAAYSFGGLIARYAAGKLLATGFLGPVVVPVNFLTIATPHLGCWEHPSSMSHLAYNSILPWTLSRTGRQLLLADRWLEPEGLPLLAVMARPDCAFHAALAAFNKRVLLADIRSDRTVPYTTASISAFNPYLPQPAPYRPRMRSRPSQRPELPQPAVPAALPAPAGGCKDAAEVLTSHGALVSVPESCDDGACGIAPGDAMVNGSMGAAGCGEGRSNKQLKSDWTGPSGSGVGSSSSGVCTRSRWRLDLLSFLGGHLRVRQGWAGGLVPVPVLGSGGWGAGLGLRSLLVGAWNLLSVGGAREVESPEDEGAMPGNCTAASECCCGRGGGGGECDSADCCLYCGNGAAGCRLGRPLRGSMAAARPHAVIPLPISASYPCIVAPHPAPPSQQHQRVPGGSGRRGVHGGAGSSSGHSSPAAADSDSYALLQSRSSRAGSGVGGGGPGVAAMVPLHRSHSSPLPNKSKSRGVHGRLGGPVGTDEGEDCSNNSSEGRGGGSGSGPATAGGSSSSSSSTYSAASGCVNTGSCSHGQGRENPASGFGRDQQHIGSARRVDGAGYGCGSGSYGYRYDHHRQQHSHALTSEGSRPQPSPAAAGGDSAPGTWYGIGGGGGGWSLGLFAGGADQSLDNTLSCRVRLGLFVALLPVLMSLWLCMVAWLAGIWVHHYAVLLTVRPDRSWNVRVGNWRGSLSEGSEGAGVCGEAGWGPGPLATERASQEVESEEQEDRRETERGRERQFGGGRCNGRTDDMPDPGHKPVRVTAGASLLPPLGSGLASVSGTRCDSRGCGGGGTTDVSAARADGPAGDRTDGLGGSQEENDGLHDSQSTERVISLDDSWRTQQVPAHAMIRTSAAMAPTSKASAQSASMRRLRSSAGTDEGSLPAAAETLPPPGPAPGMSSPRDACEGIATTGSPVTTAGTDCANCDAARSVVHSLVRRVVGRISGAPTCPEGSSTFGLPAAAEPCTAPEQQQHLHQHVEAPAEIVEEPAAVEASIARAIVRAVIRRSGEVRDAANEAAAAASGGPAAAAGGTVPARRGGPAVEGEVVMDPYIRAMVRSIFSTVQHGTVAGVEERMAAFEGNRVGGVAAAAVPGPEAGSLPAVAPVAQPQQHDPAVLLSEMIANLNQLEWQKVDVDTQHYHAHAAIVVRSSRRFRTHMHIIDYAVRQLRP